jgi:hypothetical protein
MGKLREQMKGDLEFKGLSQDTQEIYLRQASLFSRHFSRSPRHLGEREIKGYLLYLIREKKASTSTVNQCYHALKFLYERTLNREWVMAKIPRVKSHKKLPVVLDREEVESLFSVTKNLKHRAILMLIYSSGLRLREAAHLKITDIDSKRMLLRIKQGKGRKDRYTILSKVALEVLREYWSQLKVLSRLFRGKVLDYLKESWESEKLKFTGTIAGLQDPTQFSALLKDLYGREWVVYAKPPFKDPETLLDYLGRYAHRIAIGNHRILKMQNDKVFFLWRDYADGNKNKTMTVEASEFIRRFLLHVLPPRFVKIRYYGLLANRNSSTILAQCRRLLACTVKVSAKNVNETWQEFLLRVCGIDLIKCPSCKKGRMIRKEVILPLRCNSPPF